MAFIYEGMGLLLAWIVKQFFWVPHRFRYGILVAGGWGNYADLREYINFKLLLEETQSASLSDFCHHECDSGSAVQFLDGPKHRGSLCVCLHLRILREWPRAYEL